MTCECCNAGLPIMQTMRRIGNSVLRGGQIDESKCVFFRGRWLCVGCAGKHLAEVTERVERLELGMWAPVVVEPEPLAVDV